MHHFHLIYHYSNINQPVVIAEWSIILIINGGTKLQNSHTKLWLINCALNHKLHVFKFLTYQCITTPLNNKFCCNNQLNFFSFIQEWIVFCTDRSQQQQAEQSKSSKTSKFTHGREMALSAVCQPYINTPIFNVSVLFSLLPSRPDKAGASSS